MNTSGRLTEKTPKPHISTGRKTIFSPVLFCGGHKVVIQHGEDSNALLD